MAHADAETGGFADGFGDGFSKDRLTVTLEPAEAALLGVETFDAIELASRVLAFWSDIMRRDPDPPHSEGRRF